MARKCHTDEGALRLLREIEMPVDRPAQATLFRGGGRLVAQRTQLLNAVRGRLAEYGLIMAEGTRRTLELARSVIAERNGNAPEAVDTLAKLMLRQIEGVSDAIGDLERQLKAEARLSTRTRQLQTMPGVGPGVPQRVVRLDC